MMLSVIEQGICGSLRVSPASHGGSHQPRQVLLLPQGRRPLRGPAHGHAAGRDGPAARRPEGRRIPHGRTGGARRWTLLERYSPTLVNLSRTRWWSTWSARAFRPHPRPPRSWAWRYTTRRPRWDFRQRWLLLGIFPHPREFFQLLCLLSDFSLQRLPLSSPRFASPPPLLVASSKESPIKRHGNCRELAVGESFEQKVRTMLRRDSTLPRLRTSAEDEPSVQEALEVVTRSTQVSGAS